jgi:hypothetical protein
LQAIQERRKVLIGPANAWIWCISMDPTWEWSIFSRLHAQSFCSSVHSDALVNIHKYN